jgi:tetratricopeptide (TPR) repeat protein/DNA-binding CsgD family transcriptional regulator
MEENDVIFTEDIYLKHLAAINGVKFTPREIDIIACLLSARRTSQIASILSIAPRTVTTHFRNIMLRLDCNSQESIINFIEKSHKLSILREYYSRLIVELAFDKVLKEISKLKREVCPSYLIIYWQNQNLKKALTQHLSNHLNLVGVNAEVRDYDVSQKIENEENPKRLILLLLERKSNPALSPASNDFDFLDLSGQPNCYFLAFFELLAKLLPTLKLDSISTSFRQQYHAIQDSDKTIVSGEDTRTSAQSKKLLERFDKRNKTYLVAACFCFTAFIISVVSFFDWEKSNKRKDKPSPRTQTLKTESASLTWNLPRSLDHYTERPALTKAIWDHLTNINERKTTTLAGLHGLGGVGKTTLAIDLIRNPNNFYEFRGWFSAETKDLLKDEYFALGEKNHLFSRNMSDDLKIKVIKEWLEAKSSSLLVYDNAPDMDTLYSFLPNKGHIIITSRNYNMPGAIEIDVMGKDEALNLLAKLLPQKIRLNPIYQRDVTKLAKILGYLPLALSQAGRYISANELSILEYLNLYETNRDSLLAEQCLPPGDQHEPVYVTWAININQLRNFNDGEKALKLLDFISYCYSENIPKKFLAQCLYGKSTNEELIHLHRILKLLRKYSLIKLSAEGVSIHRLLHEWIKAKHSNELKLAVLRKIINALELIYPWDTKHFEDIEFVRILTPHIQLFFENTKLFLNNIETLNLVTILGNSYETLGDYQQSEKIYEIALDVHRKRFGVSHIKTADVISHLGWVSYNLGNYSKAKDLFEEALSINERYYGPQHQKTADVLRSLGWVYLYLGDYAKSSRLSQRALTIVEKLYGSNHIEMAKTLRELGRADRELGNYIVGLQRVEKSLQIFEKHYGKDHIETARTLRSLGRMYYVIGRIGAKDLTKRALDIMEKYYGPDHSETSKVLDDLGWQYFFLGQYNEAKIVLERALSIRQRHYGANHIKTSDVQHILGLVYLHLNNYDKAKHQLENALSTLEKHFGSDHVGIIYILNSLGTFYSYQGNYREAKKVFEKAVTITNSASTQNKAVIAMLLANFANVQRLLNNLQESRSLLEKAHEVLSKIYGVNNLHVAKVKGNLGLLYGDLADLSKKKEYLQHGLAVFKQQLPPNHRDIDSISSHLQKMERIPHKNEKSTSKLLGYFIIW